MSKPRKVHPHLIKKEFILDTNVLIHDPNAVEAFQDNAVTILPIVLEELERFKNGADLRAAAARQAIRNLSQVLPEGVNIREWVRLPSGGLIRFWNEEKFRVRIPPMLDPTVTDNAILACVQRISNQSQANGNHPVILVSKDRAFRLKVRGFGLRSEDYQHDKVQPVDELYTGIVNIPVDASFPTAFCEKGVIGLRDAGGLFDRYIKVLHPNVCIRFVPSESEGGRDRHVLGIYNAHDETIRHVPRPTHWVDEWTKYSKARGVLLPRNDEQCLAYALAFNPDIPLVSFAGIAGTGKTLIALAAGLQALRMKRYDRIQVFRPTRELGEPMGFLPGTLGEKFEPWMKPIIALLQLLDIKDKDLLKSVEIQPINFIQGATLPRTFVILDESQNISGHDAQIAVTRIGEGSKMVMTGDLRQVVGPYLDARSSGIAKVMATFPGQELYGHLTLVKSERSALAQLAATIM